ncbi:hypothetical protein SAMN04490357_1230 [Streptomyces misionensis]|uniref:NAD(+)--protein-arginine ADP-ribosyltransferase n=1 Tax=Streptomyces misionensis TaxID=67331 RepID=A0A1H4PX37_9ACTN|nr:hypothetical protein [Streptomyces misionensis]SEC11762.1 hypothetical protein SAMN04490357_1230 [Streptomyces misionensis]
MRRGLGAARLGGTALQCRAEGRALLVHPKGEPDPHAAAFAAGLAPDPQHTLAVVDLPHGALEGSADAVARLLAGRGDSLRLVFGRSTPQEARAVAQRIADRLDRLVLAPDGELLPTSGGGLFIPSDHGAGWLRFRPGRAAERDSRRFPKPRWEFSTFDRPWPTSGHGVAEPVPSGVWVRSPHDHAAAESGRRLVDRLPSHPDILTVVLGSPGGPPVTLADVTRLWETVLPSARSWVRFLHLGPVALPEGAEALGQELADALGQQVVLYAGVPVEARVGLDSPEVAAVRPDGTLGHRPFVSELMYFPRTGEVPAPPALFGLRGPLFGVPEITTGVYEYAADAVLEVVQSGLWMRPLAEPAGGDAVRRIPAAPGYAAILYDRSTPGAEERMRSLAEDMLWRLDPERREGFTVAPADEPGQVAVTTDDAHLWSAQAPAATGPQAAAAVAPRGPVRPAGAAPWTPAQPPRAETRETGAGASSALAYLDVDAPPAAGRGDASPAMPPVVAPPAARTESEVPSAVPPKVETDGEPARGDAGAVASAAAGSVAPQRLPDAPVAVPAPSPGDGPAPASTAQGPAGPVPPGPVPPAPAGSQATRPAAPARVPLPNLPAVSEPGGTAGPDGPMPQGDTPQHADTPTRPSTRRTDVPPRPPAPEPGGTAGPNGPMPRGHTPQHADTPTRPSTPATRRTDAPPQPPAPEPVWADTPSAPSAPETGRGPAGVPTGAPSPVSGAPAAHVPTPPAPPAPGADGPQAPPPTPTGPGPRHAPAGTPAGAPEGPGTGTPGPVPSAPAPRIPTPPAVGVPRPQSPEATGPGPQGAPQAPSAPGTPDAEAPRVQSPAPAPAVRPAPAPARMIRLESDSPAAAPAEPAGPADGGRAEQPVPSAVAGGTATKAGAPAAAAPGVRVQPVPKASACAVPPERGIAKERDWVRRTLSTQYNAVAGTVSRVMSESPGLRGGARGEGDALTDLVAVRLFLSGDHAQVNEAVRTAAVGPHVPLARCVASGLRRLPSYRGAALLRARATAAERAWFREGRLVSEWSFCTAYSAPHPGPPGGTDFLIWSITARRTNLIDPAEPDRVVFLPGTTFKVLRPSDGEGPVLLRELSPSEIASDGKVDVQRVPLDEIALDGLDRAASALRADDAAERDQRGGARAKERFGTPPGLIGGPPRQRPRGNGGAPSAPDEGAKL